MSKDKALSGAEEMQLRDLRRQAEEVAAKIHKLSNITKFNESQMLIHSLTDLSIWCGRILKGFRP
jgi:cell fate (sporulation/competence/biofilm development) regulator YlbF (YheA/YmcA/DUF963 family)